MVLKNKFKTTSVLNCYLNSDWANQKKFFLGQQYYYSIVQRYKNSIEYYNRNFSFIIY